VNGGFKLVARAGQKSAITNPGERQNLDLCGLLSGKSRIARYVISQHVQKITLSPEGRVTVASGGWDLLDGMLWLLAWCRGNGWNDTAAGHVHG